MHCNVKKQCKMQQPNENLSLGDEFFAGRRPGSWPGAGGTEIRVMCFHATVTLSPKGAMGPGVSRSSAVTVTTVVTLTIVQLEVNSEVQ